MHPETHEPPEPGRHGGSSTSATADPLRHGMRFLMAEFTRRVLARGTARTQHPSATRLEQDVDTMVQSHAMHVEIDRADTRAAEAQYANERADCRFTWMEPEIEFEEKELEALREKTLASLEPVCRKAFMLVREEGVSAREVANVMGISPVMVGLLVAIAQGRFRDALHDAGYYPPPQRDVFEAAIAARKRYAAERAKRQAAGEDGQVA